MEELREIKFRAWDGQDKQMRTVKNLMFNRNDEVDIKIEEEWFATGPELVLMQYTGLKDKNGVEIYEGDLVEHDDNIDGEWVTYEASQIVYDEEYAQFCFEWDSSNFLTNYKNLEVIGNIYENKELLED